MDLVQCAHSPNTKADCVTELLCTLPFRRYNSSLQKYFETVLKIKIFRLLEPTDQQKITLS